MRITNKIIQNNAITNINGNKILEDKLNTQLATGSKVNRPSDDPVVAIRALRLRGNLSEVNQFYKKNVPDGYPCYYRYVQRLYNRLRGIQDS